jgi:long-chain acyl-CoA synthetase
MPAIFSNLVELYERSCAEHGERPVFGTKLGGEWVWTTYRELGDLIAEFRGGLAALGVGTGDRVAIVSNNRLEWAVAAYATYGLEAIFVPMYEAQRAEEWEFILADSGAKLAIGSSATVVAALDAIRQRLPTLEHVVALDAPESDSRSYLALRALGRRNPTPARYPAPDSIAGFVYTSGTTGRPKGVMLSHSNIASNIVSIRSVFPVLPDDRTLAFLPWAHAYGQVVETHIVVSAGASTAINDEVSRLLANLEEVKPTILIAVPRIFNKIHGAVFHQMQARPRFVQALFRAGIASAQRKQRGNPLGPLQAAAYVLADRLIFHKIRARFGGRLKYLISGSAALSSEVAAFIDAVGIEVYEGYGLTETSPIVSANRPGTRRLGSAGRAIPGVRIEIDESVAPEPGIGEIVVYGPNVMKGYHHRDDETRKVLQADGGFRTGDLGRVDADGYLWITGRIKEQYKLENGKYVTPSPLEEELKLSRYVANVMLYGADRAYNVALIVLDRGALREWADQNAVELGDPISNPAVRSLIASEIERCAARFRTFERPRDFVLTLEDFTTENGMLTPTLKLKRDSILRSYRDALEALYLRGAAGARERSESSRLDLR